jgi:site-specific DNA-methyltransferase (adenine-specific)
MLNLNTINNEDCLTGLHQIADESIDLILTDPPFGINFNKKLSLYKRKPTNVVGGYCEVSHKNYAEFTTKWIRECFRILKKTGTMYIVSGSTNLIHILNSANSSGFHLKNFLVWEFNFPMYNKSKYITNCYPVVLLEKTPGRGYFNVEARYSNTRSSYHDRGAVSHIRREYWRNKLKTPTKLPTALIEKYLAYSSRLGDIVLDPFVGSGQVPLVAKNMGRQYIGFEISEPIFNFAQQRLK